MKQSWAWQKTSGHASYQMAYVRAQAEVLRKNTNKIKLLNEGMPRMVLPTKAAARKNSPWETVTLDDDDFTTFIRKKLEYYSTEQLLEIINTLGADHEIPNGDSLDREKLIELCAILQESHELFRMLDRISILKKEIDELRKKER